ncbi:hypothetical protein ABI59_13060 [Acidobacteria bacterium Mor1]|nr:hypothetical protein ABI59_13060 [Acidobacteria bacterium Mor1]
MRKTNEIPPAAGRLLPILWIVLLACLACGSPQQESSGDASQDAPPRRIVSLTPSITEILFALGLGERIVGVTQFCDWPAEAAAKPQVGGYSNPSIESVLAQRPDLVLVSPNTGNREAALAIERAGVRLEVIEGDSLEETYLAVRQVADAAGVPEEGQRLAAEIRARIDEAGRRVAGREPVPALFSVQLEPMIAAGSDTLISELLEAAGGRNVVQAEGYPRLGIETVLQSGPAVVFQTRMGMEAEEERALTDAFWQRWPALPAVRDGRVALIDASIATRPGPRIADAVDELARRLHPEAFETP